MLVRQIDNSDARLQDVKVDIEMREVNDIDEAKRETYRPLTRDEKILLHKFISEFKKKVPSIVDLWISDAAAAGGISIVALFPNGARRFFEIKVLLSSSLRNNLYDWYYLPTIVILSVALDAATVSAEAFSVTTPMVLIIIGTGIITLPLLLARMFCGEDKTHANRRIAHILEETGCLSRISIALSTLSRAQINNICDLIEGIENSELRQAIIEFVKVKLGLLSVDKTYIELVKLSDYLEQHKIRDYLLKCTTVKQSYIESLLENVHEARTRTAKYVSNAMNLGMIPGFVLWKWMADELQKDDRWLCPVYPMWAMYSSKCSVTNKADAMSGITLLWDCITGAGLATYSATMLIQFINIFLRKYKIAEKLRTQIDRLDTLYDFWMNDEISWAHHELVRKVNQRWGIPVILTLAMATSYSLFSAYGDEVGCTPSEMIHYMYSGDRPADGSCNTTEISMGISLFVCLFEFFIGYPSYTILDMFSNIVSAVATRCTQLKNLSIEKTLAAINWLKSIEGKGHAMGGLAVVITTNVILLKLISFSNTMLREGNNLRIEIDNSTNPNINPADFNFTGITQLDATHYLINLNPACPQYGILLVFVLNWLGLPINCDPILIARTISSFAGPYWGGSSMSFAYTSEAVISAFMMFCTLKLICESLERTPESYMRVSQNRSGLFAPERSGCLEKVKYFFNPSAGEHRTEFVKLKSKLIPSENLHDVVEMVGLQI